LLLARLHRAAIAARRRDRTSRYLAWSLAAGVLFTIMLLTVTGVAALLWLGGAWWVSLIVVGALVFPLVASSLARNVLVPLGAHRFSYYSALWSRPGPDAQAYALCMAAWAVATKPTGTGEAWVARKRELRMPLGDAEVVATALLAAARGDADGARQLLRSVLMIVEVHEPVRELAGEWLACDAAARGAWHELADDATAGRWPATPLTYFLEGVATRRAGTPSAPGVIELWARWMLAPHRAHTRALRDESLAASPRAPMAPMEPEPDVDAPEAVAAPVRAPLPHAISSHLAFARRKATAVTLGTTVRAWDAALADSTTHGWLARRAMELDAPLGSVDRALRELTTAITDQIARIADAAELSAPTSHGPIGNALARRLRHGRLDALEAGFTAWVARRDEYVRRSRASAAHPAIDEWREFVALKEAYDATCRAGGLELRRLAFPHAFSAGTAMAAWLWNTFDEYALSHAISKWLYDEALVVGDSEAIELGQRNCELHVPTRTSSK
ncbi:MAG: SLC41A family transporter, partial [Kofleriaceae bacterium]